MKRGISPLVATFLLIAFTLVVAGILAGWATNLAQQQRALAEECQNAHFLIKSASYNTTSSRLALVVDNWGSLDLNLSVTIIYKDGSTQSTDFYIPAQQVRSTVIDGVQNNIDEVTMRSKRCNMVYDSISSDYIKIVS